MGQTETGRRGFLKGLGALAAAGFASKATAGLANRQAEKFGDDAIRRCVCGSPLTECQVQETGQHKGAMTPTTRARLVEAVDEEIEQPPLDLILPTHWRRVQVTRDDETGDWILNGETIPVVIPTHQVGRKLRAVLGTLALPARLPARPRGHHFLKRKRRRDGQLEAHVEFSDFRISEEEAGLMEFHPTGAGVDPDEFCPKVAVWPCGTQHLEHRDLIGIMEGNLSLGRVRKGYYEDVPSEEFEAVLGGPDGEGETEKRRVRLGLEGALAGAQNGDTDHQANTVTNRDPEKEGA